MIGADDGSHLGNIGFMHSNYRSRVLNRVAVATFLAFGIVATPALMPTAKGQAFPERDIRLLIPTASGSTTDIVSRIVAEAMEDALGTSIVPENLPGGGGSVASSHVLSATPHDGHTLLAFSTTNIPAIEQADPAGFDDWLPYIVGEMPIAVMVRQDSPFETFSDLISAAAGQPQTVIVGAGLPASVSQLNALELEEALGIEFQLADIFSLDEELSSLLDGEIDAIIAPIGIYGDALRGGLIEPLAVLSPEAFDLPGIGLIPSAFENFSALYDSLLPLPHIVGILSPVDVSDEASRAVLSSLDFAISSNRVFAQLTEMGWGPSGSSGDEAREIIDVLVQANIGNIRCDSDYCSDCRRRCRSCIRCVR